MIYVNESEVAKMRRRYRKLRRRKHKTLMRNTIIIMVVLTLGFATGYSAFQTVISINAKGNIKRQIAPIVLKNKVVNSGDGLYASIYENDRYIYRGYEPDNYVLFNNSLWRIISVENDNTIKIIKDDSLDSMPFDEEGYRNNDNNTYCTSNDGCNEWGINNNISGGLYTTQNATINDYLNNDYYSTLSENSKKYIEKHDFNVGRIYLGYEDTNYGQHVSHASATIQQYWIALLNTYDYIIASLDENCTNIYRAKEENGGYCKNQNYLNKTYNQWTLNGTSLSNKSWVWAIDNGMTNALEAKESREIRPVLYLKSNIYISGKGTKLEPYQLLDN